MLNSIKYTYFWKVNIAFFHYLFLFKFLQTLGCIMKLLNHFFQQSHRFWLFFPRVPRPEEVNLNSIHVLNKQNIFLKKCFNTSRFVKYFFSLLCIYECVTNKRKTKLPKMSISRLLSKGNSALKSNTST